MAALQGIKRRIRSVSSTRQITKAMQMVAASKLRRAQDAAMGPQAYVAAARELLGRLGTSSATAGHPFFEVRPVKRALTVVVAGDRGMAGAYNSNILRSLMKHERAIKAPLDAICIGRYAGLHVARLKDVTELAAYQIEGGDPVADLAEPVLRQATELYLEGKIDRVDLIFTRFVSTVKQEVQLVQLLPVVANPEAAPAGDSEFEPDAETLVDYAVTRLLEAQVLQAVLEARASEQAARMLAMMNATDNAKDLISDLTLEFNNARQAAITQEIAEISAGAEAIA